MRQMWVWMLVMLALVNEWCHCCYGCLEEERIGLLEIKAWINHPNGNALTDWVDNKKDADCCEWYGVECDNTTKRVVELSLGGYGGLEDLCLNASLFLPLIELKSLNLNDNGLLCCFKDQGFEVLSSKLRKLEILDLRGNWFYDSILLSLNQLSSLKSLDLSYNELRGSTSIKGLRNLKTLYLDEIDMEGSVLIESLGALPSLKTFYARQSDLSRTLVGKGFYNSTTLEEMFLDKSSLPTNFLLNIGHLSTLKVLSLTDCDLNGTLPAQGIYNLTNLEELFLGYASLPTNFLLNIGALSTLKVLSLGPYGTVPTEGIYNLTDLEELYLYSVLPTNFLLKIRALTILKVLSLSMCDLNGTFSALGLCELKNLQQLKLTHNQLEGSLPSCLRNLSSLQLLDVSSNQLVGNIGSSVLTNLTSLKYLDLSSNHFEVPISFKSFVNHSNLKFLSCDHNKPIVEPLFQSIIPKFQLKFFSFSNCTLKLAEIPNFLYNQYDLRVLLLSYNNFTGMFPSWLFENNTRLELLSLRDNFFRGPLQFQFHPNPHLGHINIANNNLSGQISRNICLVFPNLGHLNMAKNSLEGGIPACFGNMSTLEFLDLSNNSFSVVKLEQFTSLSFLKLSNNHLEGHISPSVFNSSHLECLYLNGNNLKGQLWDISSINRLSLEALDISDNSFSGMLPKWIGNMSNLRAIDLSQNHFKGPILKEFCNLASLEYFDLSDNSLSGSIPSCFNTSRITHIHLSKNQLNGPLTSSFLNIPYLVALDLSNNNFSGPIPNWIGNLSRLSVLVLKANAFGGELPIQLCKLEQLSILDVSKNKLFGSLPSCLGNLTFKAANRKRYFDRSTAFLLYRLFDKSNFVSMGLPNLDDYYGEKDNPYIMVDEVVEFTTKSHSYLYKGDILNFMSGMDLSFNRFSGNIPSELGKLDGLRALNLSHNNFNGSLPATFSKLNQIESLDLSHNSLTGVIPPELTVITTLEVFSVAYNNLSGKTPEMKNQFGTFDESSYEGNPLLCGPPLQTNCTKEESLSSRPNGEEKDDDSIDMDVFYVSFVVSYIIVVLTIAVVLYINPYWRRRWFYFIEECKDTCYYFVVDSFHKLSSFKRS